MVILALLFRTKYKIYLWNMYLALILRLYLCLFVALNGYNNKFRDEDQF